MSRPTSIYVSPIAAEHPLPRLPDQPYVGVQPFMERVRDVLMRLHGQLATRNLEVIATVAVQREFRTAEARNDLLMFADGAVLKGGEVTCAKSGFSLTWATEFYPAPRYVTEVGFVPLGYYEEFDLYLMPQGRLPPTIVARFGAGPDEFLTANPFLLTHDQVVASGPQFAEALRRIDLLNGALSSAPEEEE